MKQDEEIIRERRLAGQGSASARVLQRGGAQMRAAKEGIYTADIIKYHPPCTCNLFVLR